MALNFYDSRNMITNSGLAVTYDQIYTGKYWEITRYARKSYTFIGMDESTANECASAKRAQYTRLYSRISTSGDSVSSVSATCCCADIAPKHTDGGLWSVDISVNETDVKKSDSQVTDPASLFSGENGRNYDGSAGLSSLSLDSVSRSGTTATYSFTSSISGFDAAGVVFQYKVSESSTDWTTGGSGYGPATVPGSGTIYCRVKYGNIESNTVTVEG